MKAQIFLYLDSEVKFEFSREKGKKKKNMKTPKK